MQDSASCHTAAATTHFLRENNVDVYEYWPSNSPFLNPIENVWVYIEHKLKKRVCTSENELYEQIESAWNAIPISLLHALYDSMPKRVRAVRKGHGKAIKY